MHLRPALVQCFDDFAKLFGRGAYRLVALRLVLGNAQVKCLQLRNAQPEHFVNKLVSLFHLRLQLCQFLAVIATVLAHEFCASHKLFTLGLQLEYRRRRAVLQLFQLRFQLFLRRVVCPAIADNFQPLFAKRLPLRHFLKELKITFNLVQRCRQIFRRQVGKLLLELQLLCPLLIPSNVFGEAFGQLPFVEFRKLVVELRHFLHQRAAIEDMMSVCSSALAEFVVEKFFEQRLGLDPVDSELVQVLLLPISVVFEEPIESLDGIRQRRIKLPGVLAVKDSGFELLPVHLARRRTDKCRFQLGQRGGVEINTFRAIVDVVVELPVECLRKFHDVRIVSFDPLDHHTAVCRGLSVREVALHQPRHVKLGNAVT